MPGFGHLKLWAVVYVGLCVCVSVYVCVYISGCVSKCVGVCVFVYAGSCAHGKKPKHPRVALSKLRLGSHNFMIERGRWTRPSIEYTHRLCKTCDMLEDEMHIFFECDRYLALCKQFLPSYLFKNPSMYTFIDFLHKADGNLLLNLSRFCYYVFKDYDENELWTS